MLSKKRPIPKATEFERHGAIVHSPGPWVKILSFNRPVPKAAEPDEAKGKSLMFSPFHIFMDNWYIEPKTMIEVGTLSLLDFCKKNSNKQQVLNSNLIDDDGTTMPLIDQAALVTHYLHLRHSGISAHYAKQAEETLSIWYEFIKGSSPLKQNSDILLATEPECGYQSVLFPEMFRVPFPTPQNPKFTFIDLFAGIGGFRMAFQNLGGECVFSSEWDEQAKKTYYENYGEIPFGDITKESTKNKIPKKFDILCAGFPCQAFSLAGKRLGFAETRGTLFFDVAEILRRHQPKAFFLENVKGLTIHDKGKTFRTILNTLDEVGYVVPNPQIVNAMYFGVPQHRERIYIIGFRKDLCIKKEDFVYPEQKEVTKKWIDVREKKPVPAKYYLSTQYITTLINHKARHEAQGHGFGYNIIPDDGIAHAIVVGGMGRESNLVIDFRQTDLTPTTRIKGEVNKQGWRKMTPREWARLQGYPDEFKIVVADASAYKQFGNSVAVPAIQATAEQLLITLRDKKILNI